MICPNCGKTLPEGANFCMDCGQRIPRCPTCGTVLQQRAKFCMVDGTRIPDEIIALIPEQAPAAEKPVEKPRAAEVPVQEPLAPVVEKAPAQKTPPVQQTKYEQKPPVRKEPPVASVPVSAPNPVAHAPKQQKPKKPQMNGKLKTALPLLVIIAVTALIALGYFVVEGLSKDKTPQAVQPEMSQMTDTAAEQKEAENTAGAEDTAPEGEPEQEAEAAKVFMPNCVDLHFDEVTKTFESIPCQLTFSYAYSDTVAENYILEQAPAEGTELTAETEVNITVSKGLDASPEGYNQKVTVTAAPDSSYGTLTLYDWEEGQWVSKFTCDATLGKKGISPDYGEGKKRTPEGVFKLGVALTANSLSNESWPVYLVSSDTCVVDDVNSADYNTIQSIRSLSSGVSYDPIGRTITQGTSNICIYIEHNGNGYDSENVVAGKGSVITICGRNSSIAPTSGCIDISSSNMKTLIGLLSYEKNPHIEIYTQ